MIWQDFMFACSMYPTRPEFLSTVQSEVETQVKRLQYHPSIAIWATNNENEAALRGNWYGTASNFNMYARDFVTLYIDTIKNRVNDLDPSRDCLSSSPTNGKASEAEGWIAKDPYSNIYGDGEYFNSYRQLYKYIDIIIITIFKYVPIFIETLTVHFYNYRDDSWDWRLFPRTRFASEYGFQSWPSPETLLTVCAIQTDPTRKPDNVLRHLKKYLIKLLICS